MKSVHLVITDLFLPKDFASGVYADLHLPSLEKMLARGVTAAHVPSTGSERTGEVGASLETHLCELFGMPHWTDAPIAPISAAFDGLVRAPDGYWLRADPVHLHLQREQLLLIPGGEVSADDAAQMCVSLNMHFAGQGMEFFAPHPQRWYLKLVRQPDLTTVPLSQAAGRNVLCLLPNGGEALRWHQLCNEIQMLLFAHPVNEAREARGELPVNSVWMWGGGCAVEAPLQKNYQGVSSDEVLSEMFAAAADIPFLKWSGQWCDNDGDQLLVFNGLQQALQRGDLVGWRDALQCFETGYAQPLWQALRSGQIARLRVDIVGGNNARHMLLTRHDAWTFWRSAQPLDMYL